MDINKITDEAKFNGFHATVLGWCALIIVFDGYDLAITGIALPAIMKDMGTSTVHAGIMVSSALFGALIGGIFFGTLADRVGRRKVIAICVTMFSVFTAVAGLTHDPIAFSAARFIAGLGIGGVMPSVVALTTEYSPAHLKTRLVAIMFCGYSVGGLLAALIGKALIESRGWSTVFFAAGAPLALVPFLMRFVPESLNFLLRTNQTNEILRIVPKISPKTDFSTVKMFSLGLIPSQEKPSLSSLFHAERSAATVSIWVAFFMCLFMVYALSSWLSNLMASAGYSLSSALTFLVVLNLGAIAGALIGSWVADKYRLKYVLVVLYAAAAASIYLLGTGVSTNLRYFLVAIAGAATIGNQILTYAYAGQLYPAEMRGTGIGWASGVGRIGAVSAPILIGALIGMKLAFEVNFMLIAIPGIIATIAIAVVKQPQPLK